MSDTQPTLPIPDATAEWVLSLPAEQKPRRRFWPWLIAAVAVLALAVGAWFLAESIVRGLVVNTIRDQVITGLALPADQEIDVTVAGTVIPQLIAGTLDDVTVSSQDVAFGPLSGDITVHAQGVPVRGDAPARSGAATVTLDTAQVQALLATIDGFPAATVALDEPNVAMSIDLKLFAVTVPVGVALTPSVADGEIVLTPAALQIAGTDITADALRQQFGVVASLVLRDWNVCIAQYIPAGLTVTSVTVVGDELVADLSIDGGILNDPALLENGVCT